MTKTKLIRITTVSSSMLGLLEGQLKFMGNYYNVIGIASFDNEASKNFLENREQIKMYGVKMTRKITPLKDIRAVVRLYKIFKKEKPLIVHSHTPKAGTLAMFAAYLARVPHRLHTIAGLPLLEVTGIRRKVLDFVEKITYFFATKIYPNSYGLMDIILTNGYTATDKVKVIGIVSYNGINVDYFNPNLYPAEFKKAFRDSMGISEDHPIFLFVGRMVTDKGVNELVSAFNKMNKMHKGAKLLLVGPYERHLDPVLPEIEKLIHNHPNIIYVGFQKDVRPFFAIANAMVFPSYREGFPNVVMQAGAMGLPTIATNINGCNEIILEGENGILIPPKNEDALYKAMLHYVSSKNLETLDSHKIRDLISSRFSRQKIWNEILKEYSALS
ncbi:MAG: glycosyltransferase family 4 protein [Croceivirga sp.]